MSSYAQAASTTIPVTPIRKPLSTSDKFSPRTPSSTTSTPYTAISSSNHSSASSTLTTPSSIKFLSGSPRQTKSVADLTANWRVRAQLNGIKVAATEEGDHHHKAPTLYPAFPPSFHHRSPLYVSPEFASRRSSSTFNTPSPKAEKYTRGAFTSPSRRCTVFDSPFSNTSENDRPQSALPSLPALRDLPSFKTCLEAPPRSSCSVCDKEPSGLSRMIVLSPCSHVFCSSCFTGTLNIVGEKNMSCMECHSPVHNFHFALSGAPNSDPVSDLPLLGNPFEESTPGTFLEKSSASPQNLRDRVAVLRIDNVPWDVTPPVIQKFIKDPIIHAHVLLDVKGKTLSNAFVQLTPENARSALRTTQNSILGQGRRARAVTVTLSSQEELMAALYPHWRGSFDGSRPSLDGLDNQQVNDALNHGLISNAELNSLFDLITTPDSHFLKVPSLPFYSLISILATFPVDVDSRLFWTCQLRDALFRVTFAAFEILASRKETKDDLVLWDQLVAESLSCRAFTTSQVFKLQQVVDDTLVAELKTPVDTPASKLSTGRVDRLEEKFGFHPAMLAALLQSFA